ncbi:MAG: autotransporter outer membrane beta-barrel domain-containing protein, partial [Rhodospirillales bacterium]|nr:autotransporter outer membrane beta-barrel domain-containing protein [Rhodospirillales bacterium]
SAYSKAFWLKPFGNLARQDTHDGVAGYDADTYGLSGGFDAEVSDGVRLGGALAWSNTDVDGAGTGNSQLSIDSYQVTLYGDYTTYSHYIVGSVGYARNKTDTTRTITATGDTPTGSYDSNQYMVNIGGGMPMQISDGGTFFTPTAGLAWTRVSSDSYTETGAGNLNLIMNPDDVDVILASVGGQIHTQIKSENGIWTPTARAGVSYDIAGDEATATATYTGGGASFNVTGAEVAQLGANVGVGATYYQAGWSVGLAYDADFKDDYVGHSAIVQLEVSF